MQSIEEKLKTLYGIFDNLHKFLDKQIDIVNGEDILTEMNTKNLKENPPRNAQEFIAKIEDLKELTITKGRIIGKTELLLDFAVFFEKETEKIK